MIKKYIHYDKLMGSAFALGIIAEDEHTAKNWLQKGVAEIKRIELQLSEYLQSSVTSLINNNPENLPVIIPDEVLQLIQRCQNIAELTQGTFDITSGALKKIYTFKNTEFSFPENHIIRKTLQSTGYKNLKLDTKKSTITKLRPGMHISFNAVGKGYASDCVKKLWINNGIESGFINAGGDLCAFGKKTNGNNWKVSISNPDKKEEPLLYMPVNNQSVATSGDYEQFFIRHGKRYSHNINPLTGLPLSGIKSVTIISPSAELSDALATAVYVMGDIKGISFINQLPNTFAIIVDEKKNIHYSNNTVYEKLTI